MMTFEFIFIYFISLLLLQEHNNKDALKNVFKL